MKHTVILLLMYLVLFSCSDIKPQKRRFEIPNNYVGVVMIFYDQPDGEQVFTEVYKIPVSGALKVKEKLNYQKMKPLFYYSGKNGEHIPYYIEGRQEEKDSNTVVISSFETGKTNKKGKEITFEVFLVSSIEEMDSIAMKRSDFVFSQFGNLGSW